MIGIDQIEYHNENDIIDLVNIMDDLKGEIIMDRSGRFFIFKDYYIGSVTRKVGIFSKRERTEFYIQRIEIESGLDDEIFTHQKDMMCTANGVHQLMEFHKKWLRLRNDLNQLSTLKGIPLNFSMSLVK